MKFLLKISLFMALILVGKFTKEEENTLLGEIPPETEPSFMDEELEQHTNVQALLREQDRKEKNPFRYSSN